MKLKHYFSFGLVGLGTAFLILLLNHFSVFSSNSISTKSMYESPWDAGSYTICTYFVPLGISEHHDKENSEMLEVWKESWKVQGWNVKVLNEDDAKLHPRYKELKEAVKKLPTVYSEKLSEACYLRWAAAAAHGCTVSIYVEVWIVSDHC